MLDLHGMHRRIGGGLTVCACLVHVPYAAAQTTVSGAVTAEARWSAAESPYLVSGDLVIRNGAVLRIDPGVTIYMAPNTNLVVESGSIDAAGAEGNPIRILSDRTRQGMAASAGDWGQWIFTPGAVGARLEHVLFEHGRGLSINGSAPVLNNVDLRNHLGAAIAIDLDASPSGAGNRASGNTINGIAVPPGDITGSANWSLRGIPYVVSGGTVSVGVSPSIRRVTPDTVEQGTTVTVTLDGVRLETLSRVSAPDGGLSANIFGGGSAAQKFVQLQVAPDAPVGPVQLLAETDAGEILAEGLLRIVLPTPAVTGISPSSVQAGAGAIEVVVTGRNFSVQSEVAVNAAAVPTRFVSSSELVATLPSQTATGLLDVQVRTPDALRPGQYTYSNGLSLTVEAPVPPLVSFTPTPVALPPDGRPHDVIIRLSKPDYRDNTLVLSIGDPAKASVTPGSVTIPAGQTEAVLSIQPLAIGTTSIVADSARLGRISVPLFITSDFRGINTAYASPLGVVVEAEAVASVEERSLVPAPVGVTVGAGLASVSPAAWRVGSETALTIHGSGIPSDASVEILPRDGIVVGAPSVDTEHRSIAVSVTTSADAQPGARRLIVRDASGRELVFSDAARSAVRVVAGEPSIESISPTFGVPGSIVQLTVRGRNLNEGMLRVLPDDGIRIDAAPTVNTAGEQMTAYLQILSGAAPGARTVQVVGPAGMTPAQASAATTFTVASLVGNVITPIASPLVGVVVGEESGTEAVREEMPRTSLLGVLVGAGVTEVAPLSGVVGNDVTITVRGAGLDAVSSVGFVPDAGIVHLGAHEVNVDGTELRMSVRLAEDAALGYRRLVLTAADRPVSFASAADGAFLVSAPVPELHAVSPVILVAGQSSVSMSIRGRNLRNVQSVRIEPAADVLISGPYEASADGTQLGFDISVGAGAASGERAIVIATPAGESSSTVQAGNLVRIARQLGATYAGIASSPLGVIVAAEGGSEQAVDTLVMAPSVGVLVAEELVPATDERAVVSGALGVVVGAAAQGISPDGWLQGASGTITVSGQGLESVAGVSAYPATGLLFGIPVAAADGSALSVAVAVAPDAEQTVRSLRLQKADGSELTFAHPAAPQFGIGSLPSITSVSPIVLEQGASVVMSFRGSNLKGVRGVTASGAPGLQFEDGAIEWSQDAYGELLSVPVRVTSVAATGSRVLRLSVYGGATSPESAPYNTVTVVPPQ